MTLIKKIRRALYANKFFCFAYEWLRLRLSLLLGKEPLIVFQMGKVGSSSVFESLARLEGFGPVYQVHYLTPGGIAGAEEANKRPHWMYRFLSAEIKKGAHRWKVVTLTREPVGRNISAFFENVEIFMEGFHRGIETGEVKTQDAIEKFLQVYPHEVPLNWFDSEMAEVFGIDVYALEFRRSEGYAIYEGDDASLLIIRLESLSSCATRAFKDFLGVEGFTLESANVADDKDYKEAYDKFRSTIELSSEYLDKLYSSKYARHFYTDEEIEGFRRRWLG